MIKAIIIDDESKARDLLELLIHESGRAITVVAKCADMIQGVAALKKHQPDVLFLDIEMPEISGLQLLEFIPNPNFEIVFATAYDQYAIKAFELAALDYLLKPIDEDKLAITIDRLGQKVSFKKRLLTYEQNRQQAEPVKICIPSSQKDYDIVLVKDILAIEANRNYSVIHTGQQKFILSKSLSHFVDQYLPIQGFVRTHRSWIVNLHYAQKLNKSTKEIILPNLSVPVSRNNYLEVKNQLLNFPK
ncbi:MAG: response regulator [Saprospiraceae bacterium]|nr:response regulator [Saprospiraceae bacterium]